MILRPGNSVDAKRQRGEAYDAAAHPGMDPTTPAAMPIRNLESQRHVYLPPGRPHCTNNRLGCLCLYLLPAPAVQQFSAKMCITGQFHFFYHLAHLLL